MINQINHSVHLKKFYVLVYVILLVAVHRPTLFAQTTNDIATNHIRALGGEENVKKILSIELSGKLINSILSKVTSYNVYKQKPNLILHENIDGTDTTYSCFDGIRYCLGSRPERETISRLSKMRSAMPVKQPLDGFIDDYLAVADKAALVKVDTVDHKPYFKLVYQYDTVSRYFYVDTTTYLIHKQVDIFPSGVRNESTFTEYTTVDGVKFPKVSKTNSYLDDAIVFSYEHIYDTIRINKNLANDVFICR